MKQLTMFKQDEDNEENSKYTSKIEAPIYKPSHKKPNIIELYDNMLSNRLINKIKASSLPEDEQRFLIEAAKRHTVFNYEKIADYYAYSSKEMQELMEESALVIIDFDKAIELGYVNVCENIEKQYLEECGEIINDAK